MTGIFIVARLGSTRLSQKHLIQAAGRTFIEWLASRFTTAFSEEIAQNQLRIFIVTSDKPENRKFDELFADNRNVSVFYGADSNIPLRQLQCAQANNISEIVSIDGDDILCSTNAARKLLSQLLKGVSYAKTTGLPLGMNVLGYRTEFLEASMKDHSEDTLETGWGRIFENGRDICLGEWDRDVRLRLTLDYPEDAEFFSAVIEGLGEETLTIEDAALVSFIIDNRMYEKNQQVNDQYWKNFDAQKNSEIR